MLRPPFLRAEILARPEIRHGFFGRLGGVSKGIYDSLQCGRGAKADPAENVAENRARAALALDLDPGALVSAYQTHSARAVVVTKPWRPEDPPEADALVTRVPGIALGILTADCAPVLFADRKAGVIGAAHAGWRGAFGGVLEAAIEAMIGQGAEPARIRAVVGPCLSQRNYQVSDAFRTQILGAEAAARILPREPSPLVPQEGAADERLRAYAEQRRAQAERFRIRAAQGLLEEPECFLRDDADPERWRFDLPAYVLTRLRRAGLREIGALGRCTYGAAESYFSNRRALHWGEPDYGRQISIIALQA